MSAGNDLPDQEAVQMSETAVMDIDLPPGVQIDPRRGRMGGLYVIATCPVCGRNSRYLLSWYLRLLSCGRAPKTCSLSCGRVLRRIKTVSGAAVNKTPDHETVPIVDDPVIDDLPPWVRLDNTHRGVLGGRYVIVTCPVCGRERQMRISEFRSGERRGFPPRACSRECGWVLRRARYGNIPCEGTK